MTRRTLLSGFALLLLVGTAVAADALEAPLKDFKLTDPAGKASELVTFNEADGKIAFNGVGIGKITVKAEEAGDYTLTLDASCDEANKTLAKIKILLNDKPVKDEFALTQTEVKAYKFDVKLVKGENKLHVEFLNDIYKENEYDLNFYLHGAKFEKKKAK